MLNRKRAWRQLSHPEGWHSVKKQQPSAVLRALMILLALLQSTEEAPPPPTHTGSQLGPWSRVRRENPEAQTFVFRSLGWSGDYDN